MRCTLFILVLLALGLSVSAQRRASVAFWNVENLYDTLPSPFYDDREWTPRGANRWDTERYRAKIENLASVIDELAADIVGLSEVENEAVVRDLVTALRTDYNYIHLTSGDSRGIDLALLYKGDKFFPAIDHPHAPSAPEGASTLTKFPSARLIPSGMGREFLHIQGELYGEHIHLIVCHLASKLNPENFRRRNMLALRAALEKLLKDDPAASIIVMGDMNAAPNEKTVQKTLGPLGTAWDFMYAPHAGLQTTRQGSYSYRGRWYLYDWMLTSPAISRGSTFRIDGVGVYAREYMTVPISPALRDRQTGRRPRRTIHAGDYEGGFSDHFPVWIVIEK